MSPSVHRILEAIRALTQDERQQLLLAVGLDMASVTALPVEQRSEFAEAVQGEYESHCESSDSFSKRKHAEAVREEERVSR